MNDDKHVDFSADLMMPAPWSSVDRGETFETGDYLCTFQVHAKTVAEELIAQGRIEDAATRKKLTSHLKTTGFRHEYTMMLYYKPGKDPSGKESDLPEVIWTLESSNVASQMFYTYSGRMHFMGGDESFCSNRNAAIEMFKKRLSAKTELPITRIGNLEVCHRIKLDATGEYWNRLKQELGIKGGFVHSCGS